MTVDKKTNELIGPVTTVPIAREIYGYVTHMHGRSSTSNIRVAMIYVTVFTYRGARRGRLSARYSLSVIQIDAWPRRARESDERARV